MRIQQQQRNNGARHTPPPRTKTSPSSSSTSSLFSSNLSTATSPTVSSSSASSPSSRSSLSSSPPSVADGRRGNSNSPPSSFNNNTHNNISSDSSNNLRRDAILMASRLPPPPRIKRTTRGLPTPTPPRAASHSSSSSPPPLSSQGGVQNNGHATTTTTSACTPKASPPPPPRVRRINANNSSLNRILNGVVKEQEEAEDDNDSEDAAAITPLLTPNSKEERRTRNVQQQQQRRRSLEVEVEALMNNPELMKEQEALLSRYINSKNNTHNSNNTSSKDSKSSGNDQRDCKTQSSSKEEEEGDIYAQLEQFGQKLDSEIQDLERLGVVTTTTTPQSRTSNLVPSRTAKQRKKKQQQQQEPQMEPWMMSSRTALTSSSDEGLQLKTPKRSSSSSRRSIAKIASPTDQNEYAKQKDVVVPRHHQPLPMRSSATTLLTSSNDYSTPERNSSPSRPNNNYCTPNHNDYHRGDSSGGTTTTSQSSSSSCSTSSSYSPSLQSDQLHNEPPSPPSSSTTTTLLPLGPPKNTMPSRFGTQHVLSSGKEPSPIGMRNNNGNRRSRSRGRSRGKRGRDELSQNKQMQSNLNSHNKSNHNRNKDDHNDHDHNQSVTTINSTNSNQTDFSSATVEAAIAARRRGLSSTITTTEPAQQLLSAKEREYHFQKTRMQRLLGSPDRLQQQQKVHKLGKIKKMKNTSMSSDDAPTSYSPRRNAKVQPCQQQQLPRRQRNNIDRTQQQQGGEEYEMLIHPESIEGTTEAAAWHLHGQAGGRLQPPREWQGEPYNSNNRNVSGDYYSVMDARTVANTLMNGEYDVDVGGGIGVGDKKRHVKMDVEEGITTLSAATASKNGNNTSINNNFNNSHNNNLHQHDQWSTGVAAAIVTGTASRYHKTLFMFPHGRRVLLPIVMGALGTALSLVMVLSCQFMTILPRVGGGNNGHYLDGSDVSAQDVGLAQDTTVADTVASHQVFQVGPWRYLSLNPSYSDGDVCLPYPTDVTFDTAFLVARSTSALAACFGCMLVLWTCTLTCIPASRGSRNMLGGCFVLNGMVQLLTVVFFQSDNCKVPDNGGGYFGGGECQANQDLVYCIAAAMLFVATGWLLYISDKFGAQDGSSEEAFSGSTLNEYKNDKDGNLLPSSSSSALSSTNMEVYTWSSLVKKHNNGDLLRTVEKCWTKLPDGSTLMAKVYVERRREGVGSGRRIGNDNGHGGDERMKTTYSIQTEILPA